MSQHKTNHLINESSPYLQQHAHNPVNWYPWGEEALNRARKENKPILLSIGYAACHWCHVMAHESFEDDATAEIMNNLFINIKVDREERPDLDKIYQATHYLLTQQRGGWPLTVFLTPDDLTPFFSGTYFPVTAKYQLPAFKDVLQNLSQIYQQRFDDIQKQNAELTRVLNPPPPVVSDMHLNQQPIQHALQVLQRNYDATNGGFGTAPKFPQPSRLTFLLQQQPTLTEDTLLRMAAGGINDQLSGGFYRYSVDAEWRIPHFEKMLYDNAQLLFLYAAAFKQTQQLVFAYTAIQTANWVMNTMQSPEGGYYSSLDADSEGHEGKYYVWDKSEVKSLLTDEEFSLIEKHYGLDQPANFEHQWHFFLSQPTEAQDSELLFSAKNKLLATREKRIPPALDTKILTAWNALMIKGMLTAGYFLKEPEYIESAQRCLSYIQQHLWKNNRLLASNSGLMGYLDDYAFLMDALLTSLQISWKKETLLFTIELADTLLTHFSDTTTGGLYFTANDHEKLLYRPISFMDEAIPAGNAIAARCLQVLGHLLGETRYIDAAEKIIQAAWPTLAHYPAEHCELLLALNDYLNPPTIVVIRGSDDKMKAWQKLAKSTDNYVFSIPANETELPGLLSSKIPHDKTCAYVCQGTQCKDVIEDVEMIRKDVH